MLREICKKVYYLIKYKGKHIKLGRGCNIGGLNSIFEGENTIGDKSLFSGYIGYGSYIGKNCWIEAKIGRFCSIANEVEIIIGDHPTNSFVSTHPAFFSEYKQAGFTFVKESKFQELKYAEDNYFVTIGNDVWIGHGARILNGVRIGDGAIIAAGSLVLKNVAPYSIVGGVPAKHIKYRFDANEINFLLDFAWWNKPIEWISENADIFTDIKNFVNISKKR